MIRDIKIALESLGHNVFRSFLTTLGIIFGVAAVISMMSISEGAKKEIIDNIKQLGLNNVIIENKSQDDLKNDDRSRNLSKGLTINDSHVISEILENSIVVSEIFSSADITIASNIVKTDIIATDEKFFKIKNLELRKGRFFDSKENLNYKMVCVISDKIANKNFIGENPIGNSIKIKNQRLNIIGVFKSSAVSSKATDGIEIISNENSIIIPLHTMIKRKGKPTYDAEINRITIQTKNENLVFKISRIVGSILKRLHNDMEDYKIVLPRELLAQAQKTQRIFNIVMGTIASISLLVGGIGITNIMLANALERRKEIGLRMAIGATKRSITIQFLAEAGMISLIGGIIGIGLGIIMTYAISKYAEWDTTVTFISIVASFAVSVSVGLISGFLPAKKAANMNPIEALHYE
ncbi:MAG: ABC transporter permease [Candidatus Delongbacteria bacterium]|jgi:putative ABC transport system permease protein|nr:ABC transporter permease [Candidatus Delongbacteria bacterium]